MLKNKFKLSKTFLIIIFLTAYCIPLTATVRYVSHQGNNTPPYTSWETAADSIMSAINISVFGDTIYVANGVYEEQVIMIPGLSLIGAGMDSCVVDTRKLANSNFFSVEILDSCILNGFKIFVGPLLGPQIGTAVFMKDSTVNCVIENNHMLSAWLGVWATDCTIQRNIISDVNVGVISAGSLDFTGTFNVFIDSNYISFFSDGIYSNNSLTLQYLVARGNIFYFANQNSTLSQIYDNSISQTFTPEFNNNEASSKVDSILYIRGIKNTLTGSFANNVFLTRFEDAYYTTALTNIKNNVIVGSINGVHRVNGTVDVRYNDFWRVDNPYVGFTIPDDTTNQRVNPMFVNEDSLDLHLQKYSPLIDAGDPDILDVDGSRSDIGSYGGPYGESYTYIDIAPKPPRNLTADYDSVKIHIKWNNNTEADFNHYNLFRDTTANFTADSTTFVIELSDTFYQHIITLGTNTLYYKITAIDNQGNESNPSEELAVIITSVNDYPATVSNYRLYQNYPNPFNPSTKIGYKLKERGYVKLYVYDIKGELISVLVNQTQDVGYYEVDFDAVGTGLRPVLASGIYIYQIIVRNEYNIPVYSEMKKMVLLK
jgi:hypothetical protein